MQPPHSPSPSQPPSSPPRDDTTPVTDAHAMATAAEGLTDTLSPSEADPALSPPGLDTPDTSDTPTPPPTTMDEGTAAAVVVNPVVALSDAPVAVEAAATAADAPDAEAEEDVAPPFFAYPPSDAAYPAYADPARADAASVATTVPPGEAVGYTTSEAPAPATTPIAANTTATRRSTPRLASSQLRTLLMRLAVIGVSICAGIGLWIFGFLIQERADESFSYAFLTREGVQFWLPGLLLAVLVGVLVWLVAGQQASPGLVPATAGIFPFVTMIAGLLIVSVYHDRSWWVVAPVVTAIALVIGTVSRTLLHDPSGTGHDIARTALTVTSYVVAFLALAMVYINKLRSIQSATAVTLLCILLLLQLTDGEAVPLARRLVYAVAGGLIVGQVTWVINYWSAPGWTGGAFLLAVFYLVAGLSAAQLRGRIGLFEVVEFGGFALFAMLFVSVAVLLQS